MSANKEQPKVFISYSWSGPKHEQFVMDLATTLRTHGVDAILDKWRLKPGQDKYVFMESMVTDDTVVKVLVLCDRKYAEKADGRLGGVGTESQIISQELYTQVSQTKFIPVVCERSEDGEAYLPVFMKSRIYVDMSSDEAYGSGLDDLLRQIFEVPLHPEPLLGEPPAFLKGDSAGALPMAREFLSAVRAIKEGSLNREGVERLFVRSVFAEVDRLYGQPDASKSGYDEDIYQAILKTKQLRNQVSDYANALASFSGDDPKSLKAVFQLLELLGGKFGPPVENGGYHDVWADHYRFFALESVLLITASLIRHERWKSLRALFKYPYLIRKSHSGPKVEDISAFDSYLESMDVHRTSRLKINRASLTADILKERCSPEHTTFSELLQADFLLALNGVAHAAEKHVDGYTQYWAPRTGVYRPDAGGLPLFLKAVDPDFRRALYETLGVTDAPDLAKRVLEASELLDGFKRLSINRSWGTNFVEATNLQALIKPTGG